MGTMFQVNLEIDLSLSVGIIGKLVGNTSSNLDTTKIDSIEEDSTSTSLIKVKNAKHSQSTSFLARMEDILLATLGFYTTFNLIRKFGHLIKTFSCKVYVNIQYLQFEVQYLDKQKNPLLLSRHLLCIISRLSLIRNYSLNTFLQTHELILLTIS